MRLARRPLLLLSAAMLAAPRLGRAQAASGPTPVLLVHGNGDHAALWMTQLWRWESNGWPRDRLLAVSMPDPAARDDDAVPQAGRSSSEEQTERLAAFAGDFSRRHGGQRIALVGNSRGGFPIRDLAARGSNGADSGGARLVSHAVTCGTPHKGVWDIAGWRENSEFSARSAFLRRLNAGPTDAVEGVALMTIRSDNDLFAQDDGRFVGRPGVATNIPAAESMALRGAENVLLPGLDHREVACSARAFREQFRFVAQREPERLSVAAEARPVLNGLVTGLAGGVATNRPVAGARVEVFRVEPGTARRMGEALLARETGADGVWGPVTVGGDWCLEFVLAAPGHPIAHTFRSPFPRSTDVLHLRPPAALSDADRAAGCLVRLVRPRGYYGWPRDVVLLDGREPAERRNGVASIATVAARLPAEREGGAVRGVFNEEAVVARAVPLAENRVCVAELTF